LVDKKRVHEYLMTGIFISSSITIAGRNTHGKGTGRDFDHWRAILPFGGSDNDLPRLSGRQEKERMEQDAERRCTNQQQNSHQT
jgi:hypothetical protein